MSLTTTICLLLAPSILCFKHQYENPKMNGLRLVVGKGKGNPAYVIKMGLKHKVPNPKTLFYLKEDLGDPQTISDEELDIIPTGSTYPSWEPKQKLKKRYESKFIVASKRVSSEIVNPAFARWQNKFITCFRVVIPHHEKDIAFKYTMDRIACQWLTDALDLNGESAFITTSGTPPSHLVGEDPRLHLTPTGSLAVYYNRINISENPHRRMVFCELQHSPHSVSAKAQNNLGPTPFFVSGPTRALNFNDDRGPMHQKNWTPFTYGNNTFFVYSVFPFHRVLKSLPTLHAADTVQTTTVTLTRAHNTSVWNFGEIRGGSPAIRTPVGYLSFFHSSSRGQSSRWWATSYFMGAYLFGLEPPFAVIRLSAEPIVAKPFYTGKWASSHTDYVPFPTAAFLSGDEVVVGCGLHDREAWIVRMKWIGLLDSLVPVQSDVLLNDFNGASTSKE